MKKSINLYHASCQQQKLNFSLKQLIILLLTCVAFSGVAALATIEFSKNNQLGRISAESELIILQNEFSSLLEAEAKRNEIQKNTKIKLDLIQKISDKEALLTSLSEMDLSQEMSFSDLMLGLSKTNTDKLTVTQFSILNNKLNIQGLAKQGELIPQWLTRMQSSPELKSVSFNGIQIIEQNGSFIFQVNNVGSTNQGVK